MPTDQIKIEEFEEEFCDKNYPHLWNRKFLSIPPQNQPEKIKSFFLRQKSFPEEEFKWRAEQLTIERHRLCMEELEKQKSLLLKELEERVEKMRIVSVAGNFDEQPIKIGEEAAYCLTCGAFLPESVCICEIKNDVLFQLLSIIKEMKSK